MKKEIKLVCKFCGKEAPIDTEKSITEFIEKEKIESEIAVFWDLFSKILPKSRARCEIGDEKLFIAFKATFIEVRKFYKE